MLRTVGDQCSLWESVLPEELQRLPGELARVDAVLDDPQTITPFVPFSFDPQMGRPSTPMETYLRLMFLKFRYGLGFESLCREVSDSITWRRFCRIALDGAVPHPTTLMKLNTRCGSVAVQGLNEALLAKAAEAKVLRTNRVRADTTVVPANVSYPTDSGLLARAIRRITVSGRRIRAAGGAMRTKLRDRSRAAGKRAHGIYRTFEQDVLVIDTKSLLGAYESNVRLSPINSGATLYPNAPARGSNTFTTIQNYPYTDRRRTRTVVEAVTELAVIDGVHDIRDHAIHVERRRGREIIKRYIL